MTDTTARLRHDVIDEQVQLVQYATMQRLLILTGVPYFVWQIYRIAQTPAWLYEIDGAGLAIALSLYMFAFWLTKDHLKLAQLCWQAGVITALTSLVLTQQFPLALFIGIALPFIAMVNAGWFSSVTAIGLVIASCSLVSPYFATYSIETISWMAVACIIMALIGRVTVSEFLSLMQWYYDSFNNANREVEQARNERVELKQVQDDLLQANKEQARLSMQLRYSNEIAEHARRVKEEFVATVSHELRTPLNMIIGFSDLISDSPRVYGVHLPSSLLADIASIQRNSQHLLELVNDVLDLSQVDSDSMAISHEWNSLTAIVNEATASVSSLFSSKGLYLKTELPPDDLSTFCDGTRVREVIINLLSNAGRFTEKGGVVVRVTTSDEYRIVAVQDTGPGIALEDQKRIFEPFQQLDTTIHRRYGGSGLGLTISRRFIEMHGGKMWVESQLGAGSTIYCSLPINLPVQPSVQNSSVMRWINPYQEYVPRLRRFKAPPIVTTARFVIVDEHDLLPHIMHRYLLKNLEIVAVHTFDEVLEETSRSPVQAVIINSPSGDLSNKIMADCHLLFGTPVITCWIPGNQDYALRLGVARYLVKPISRDTLIAELGSLGTPITDVLIVDDNPEALQLFGRILQSADHSYRIMRAMSGRQALELLRSRKPDVMILDLIMPETSGFDVLKEKLTDPLIRDIPVLVVSSRDPSGAPIVSDRLTVLREGGFSIQDLVSSIMTISDNLALKKWNDAPEQQ